MHHKCRCPEGGGTGSRSRAWPLWYAAVMLRAYIACGVLTVCAAIRGGGYMFAQGAKASAQGPLVLALEGRGVQVYRCDAMGGMAAWVQDHPEADLLDARRKVVGHHDAGPSWHLEDGSGVMGEVVEKMVAAEPRAIPWLLLRVTSHEGSGVLAAVATIRRTETHGGVAPAQGCDSSMVGATVRVPYTATYTFYGKP